MSSCLLTWQLHIVSMISLGECRAKISCFDFVAILLRTVGYLVSWQCWKFLSPGRPRLPTFRVGLLIPTGREPWWATWNDHISASRSHKKTYNHSNWSAKAFRSIIFSIPPSILMQNGHHLSIRAINFCSGLPALRLQHDFYEFTTLSLMVHELLIEQFQNSSDKSDNTDRFQEICSSAENSYRPVAQSYLFKAWAIYSKRQVALVGDLKSPYLCCYKPNRLLWPLKLLSKWLNKHFKTFRCCIILAITC